MQNIRNHNYPQAPALQVHVCKEQKTKLIITDVDGTLASFWDYFVPAMRQYLSYIENEIDIPIAEFTKDLGAIIDARGTHEYPWLLESTEFARQNYAGRVEEFTDKFVRPFWEALDENRSKYLRPFPGVMETLQDLRSKGVKIVALSDAPDHMARIRNKQLFNGLLDAVYALDTPEPDSAQLFDDTAFEFGRQRVSKLREACSDSISPLTTLPVHYEKPNALGIDRVMQDFGVFPHEVVFVGDSVVKDGLATASRGVRFVWAHYGTNLPAEYDEMIHYSLKPEAKDAAAQPYLLPPAVAVAARYDELLNHV